MGLIQAGRFRTAVVLLTLLVGTGPLYAKPLTFNFGGQIDFVRDGLGLDGSVFPGAPFGGTYSFDPNISEDYYPDTASVGFYGLPPPFRMSVQIGNYVFTTNELGILIWDNVQGCEDRFELINLSPFQAAGRQWSYMIVALRDWSGTALASDMLPAAPPDLAAFGYETTMGLIDSGREFAIKGTLTSLTPEPGSLAILSVGAGLVAVLRTGRRRA